MTLKRSHATMTSAVPPTTSGASASPFLPMFTTFRTALDAHHDQRDRLNKASRDVTSASKKIIFALQRAPMLAQPLPPDLARETRRHYEIVAGKLAECAPDLRAGDAWRYKRQVTGGLQEFVEAETFRGYLESGRLVGYEECRAGVREMSLRRKDVGTAERRSSGGGGAAVEEGKTGEDDPVRGDDASVDLSPDDYLLGIYDMTGELMRFAITAMATSQSLPSLPITSSSPSLQRRTILTDLRALRAALESLDFAGAGPMAREVEKKAEVMRASVEKVEKALYGLVVRGAERPKGWMPEDEELGRRVMVEVEG